LSFTKPGEVPFNLLALLHLSALLLSAAFLSGMPELALDWRFWVLFVAGPLVFWVGVKQGLGFVFDSSTGVRLPNGNVRLPDVAFVANGRLEGDVAPEDFCPVPPDLAARGRLSGRPSPIRARQSG